MEAQVQRKGKKNAGVTKREKTSQIRDPVEYKRRAIAENKRERT